MFASRNRQLFQGGRILGQSEQNRRRTQTKPSKTNMTKKSSAELKREIEEIVATPAPLTSEALVAQMIGRRVKSGWTGLVNGEIIQWEPFNAGGTDVLVKDSDSGHLTWYASHGLTPIDGKGPLPSRSEVRRIREEEMKVSMKKIADRWAKEPPPPRVRR